MEFIKELNLGSKLLPWKNPGIAWAWVFVPALVAYFMMMGNLLNEMTQIGVIKAEVGMERQFRAILPDYARMEVIASGLQWAEGPVWIEDSSAGNSYLLFSDSRVNRIYKWEEGKGLFTVGKTVYLENSGCTSGESGNPDCPLKQEPGSNGLLRHNPNFGGVTFPSDIDLIACQHGDRALAMLMANGTKQWIATKNHDGKRFNSPNDLVRSPDGHVYFSDPHYGLYNNDGEVEGREADENGVYLIRGRDFLASAVSGRPTSRVILLDTSYSDLNIDDSHTTTTTTTTGEVEEEEEVEVAVASKMKQLLMPNGLAFSPDYSTLYISDSHPDRNIIVAYDVAEDGSVKPQSGRVLYSMTAATSDPSNQLPDGSVGNADGMAVDIYGGIWTSGPGGVHVVSPHGELIGRLLLDRPASNIVFGPSGSEQIFITAKDIVVRVSGVKTRPAEPPVITV
jgi:gluconolactonase